MMKSRRKNPLPNLDRAVSLRGQLSKEAARQALVKVKAMGRRSRAPITLSVESSGGMINALKILEKAIPRPGSNGQNCKIITVTSEAISAAAFLVVMGNHAYLYEGGRLHFHGVRCANWKKINALNSEKSFALALRLDRENRRLAGKLATSMIPRVVSRYHETKMQTPQSGQDAVSALLAMVRRFLKRLSPRLSTSKHRRMIYESFERLKLIAALSEFFPVRPALRKGRKNALLEFRAYQKILAHELQLNSRPDWTMKASVCVQMMLDYLLAREIIRGRHLAVIRKLARESGARFLTRADTALHKDMMASRPGKARAFAVEKTLPVMLFLWYFTFILSHRLLRGEHTLTTTDAYWLGMVDDVIKHKPNHPTDMDKPKPG